MPLSLDQFDLTGTAMVGCQMQTSSLTLQDMSAAPFASLDLLHLRPENFVKYLVQELQFTHVRDLEVQSSANGFNRPIHLMLRT